MEVNDSNLKALRNIVVFSLPFNIKVNYYDLIFGKEFEIGYITILLTVVLCLKIDLFLLILMILYVAYLLFLVLIENTKYRNWSTNVPYINHNHAVKTKLLIMVILLELATSACLITLEIFRTKSDNKFLIILIMLTIVSMVLSFRLHHLQCKLVSYEWVGYNFSSIILQLFLFTQIDFMTIAQKWTSGITILVHVILWFFTWKTFHDDKKDLALEKFLRRVGYYLQHLLSKLSAVLRILLANSSLNMLLMIVNTYFLLNWRNEIVYRVNVTREDDADINKICKAWNFIESQMKSIFDILNNADFKEVLFPILPDLLGLQNSIISVLRPIYSWIFLICADKDVIFHLNDTLGGLILLTTSTCVSIVLCLMNFPEIQGILKNKNFWRITLFLYTFSFFSLFMFSGFQFVLLNSLKGVKVRLIMTEAGVLIILQCVFMLMSTFLRATHQSIVDDIKDSQFTFTCKNLMKAIFNVKTLILIISLIMFVLSIAIDFGENSNISLDRKEGSTPNYLIAAPAALVTLGKKTTTLISNRLLAAIWVGLLAKKAIDQVPCANFGVYNVCLSDLLSSPLDKMTTALIEGVPALVDLVLSPLKSTLRQFLNVIDDFIEKLSELDLNFLNNFNIINLQKPTIDVFKDNTALFIAIVVIISVIVVVFVILALKGKINMMLEKVNTLMISVMVSILCLLIQIYSFLDSQDYTIKFTLGNNLVLFFLSVFLFLIYINILGEHSPYFFEEYKLMYNFIVQDDTYSEAHFFAMAKKKAPKLLELFLKHEKIVKLESGLFKWKSTDFEEVDDFRTFMISHEELEESPEKVNDIVKTCSSGKFMVTSLLDVNEDEEVPSKDERIKVKSNNEDERKDKELEVLKVVNSNEIDIRGDKDEEED